MFDTLEVARLAIRQIAPLVARVAARDPDLARQLRRAATSVPLNIAEGRERRGKDRAQLYRVAAGSAAEAVEALQVALAWGYIADAADALDSLDRVRAMLWKQTH
jgi:four helix bundle protein